MKHGSNSTHPVIFGIRTVECIVAVIRRSWSDLVLLSICFNSSLYKDSSTLLFGLRKQARRRKRGREGEKKGDRRLFLIPGFCGACGKKSQRDGDKRKKEGEQSFLQPRKEGRVSASVWLSDLQECHICGRASLLFLAGCLWPAVSFSSSFSLCLSLHVSLPTQFVWILLGYSHCRGTWEADWFVRYSLVVFYSSPIFFSVKVPR